MNSRPCEIALELQQQVEDLRLHREVERRGRLVADDQPRARAPAPGRSRSAGAGRRRSAGIGVRLRVVHPDRASAARRSALVAARQAVGAQRLVDDPPQREAGSSESYGSWKTIPIRRRTGRSRAGVRGYGDRRSAARPGGRSRPSMIRPTVVLPDPDSPTIPTFRPAMTQRDPVERPDVAVVLVDLAELERRLIPATAPGEGMAGERPKGPGRP